MAFKLLFAPGRHDQIGDLRRQEAPQPAHAFDFTDLVGDALLKLLVEFDNVLGSFAQFAEQARVFDSDHRLRGEVLQQLDLLFTERPDFLPIDGDRANQSALLEH
jgi:hypothetical protein